MTSILCGGTSNSRAISCLVKLETAKIRAAPCNTRLVNWKCSVRFSLDGVHAIHVIEQIVHGDDVRTWDTLRLPEQMRHVQQVAAVFFQDPVQFEIAGDRELVGLAGDGNEVRRQRPDVAEAPARANVCRECR